jgi:serine/threonine protein kinase
LLRVVPATNVEAVVPPAAASASNQPPPSAGAAPGDRVGADGRYELVARIGSGGMGAVYRALDHKLGCERAVKVLDARYAVIPAFVERFRREAMAASRVAHPNIVSVLDVAAEGERPVFLVMELLEGKTLSQLAKSAGRLPWSQVQRYADQIAAGLGAAHAHGVVHRDVKPGNCLVLADDQVKILDFGIAKVTDMPAQVVALTAAGEIIGTCSYMAPEQIRGQVDKRSDIYALGVVVFRLLTGRVPFSHRDQDKVLLAHLTEPPPAPSSLVPDLPPGVDDLVLRMLAKQPHKRFDSMEELRRALAGIERGVSVALEPPTAQPPGSRTAMFEDAPTQAVTREGMGSEVAIYAEPLTPSLEAERPVRARVNTAPAGSGTLAQLAQLDAQGSRLPGTVVLDEGLASPPSPVGGSTVVVSPGQPTLALSPASVGPVASGPDAPPPAVVARPFGAPVQPRMATVPTPVPRPLGSLSASAGASPRVTRISAPEPRGDAGMMRGVFAAIGGIALAAAVVAGWVLYQRHRAEPEPVAGPAATRVDEAEPAPVEGAAVEGAAVEGTPVEGAAVEGAAVEGAAVEGTPGEGTSREAQAVPSSGAGGGPTEQARGSAPAGEAGPVTAPTSAVEAPAVDPKTKKRRKPKGDDAKTPDVTSPQPPPDETKPKTPKKGDIRDPF